MILYRLDQRAVLATRDRRSNERVEAAVREVVRPIAGRYDLDADEIAVAFSQKLDEIIELCEQDAARYPVQDPALEHFEEVFHASNGFWATVAYRVAHGFTELDVPIIPRAISRIAHTRTSVDIHPLAKIGGGLFIDHGTGIAIGCTAVIGENVSLYNGVVLGTSRKPRKRTSDAGEIEKRHPTIGRDVALYTNAFVGGDVLVGEGATIGAYAFVCRDVAAGEVVLGTRETNVELSPKAEFEIDLEVLDEAISELYLEKREQEGARRIPQGQLEFEREDVNREGRLEPKQEVEEFNDYVI